MVRPQTRAKLDALKRYFGRVAARDAAWAAYFLAGGRPRQAVATKVMRQAAISEARLPEWLFDECYLAVGDLAETIALVLPAPLVNSTLGLADWIEERILPLRSMSRNRPWPHLRDTGASSMHPAGSC